nr:MAG TPA: Inovirus Gp2 [Caudoviricetes sp.]
MLVRTYTKPNNGKCKAFGSEYLNWTKEKLVSELLSLNLSSKFTLQTLRNTKLNQMPLSLLRREYRLALSKQKRKLGKMSRTKQQTRYRKLKRSRKDNFLLKRMIHVSDLPHWHYLKQNPEVVPPLRKAPYWLLDILQMDNNERRKLDYNYNKIKDLIRSFFILNSKVMVIRMDLCLNEEEKRDIGKLNGYLIKLIKGHLYHIPYYLGYYCCREYTEKTGVHAHCYFFFNANRNDQDLIVAKNMGLLWTEISNGRWFSTNFSKDKLPDGGDCLGTIEYWEIEKIERLLNNSKYLLKEMSNRDWLDEIEGENDKRKLFTSSKLDNPEYLFIQHEALLVEDTSRKYRVSYSWLENCKLCRHYSVLPHLEEYRKPNPLFKRGRPKRLLH